MKMKMLLFSAAALFALPLPAATFSEWQFRQDFDVPGAGLIKLSLPPATLDAGRADLADLRVADAAGNEVPYLLERPTPAGKVVRNAKSFKVALEQNATVITLETGLTQPLGAVRLTTPASSFIKALSVAGSADGQTWQTLTSGQPLFQQPNGASQLRVELTPAVWPWLRLTVDDRGSSPVPFTGAEVEAAQAEPVPSEPVAVRIVERVENPGETRLTLNLGAAHLRLASLEVESPEPLFRRQLTLAARQVEENTIREKVLASGSIYRVAVPGQAASVRLTLPLDIQAPTRELLLLIQNQDSPPLQLTEVRAQRRPVYLLFLASSAARYSLYVGNSQCPAPRYDLASQGIDASTAKPSATPVGALLANPAFRAPETLPSVADLGAALDVSAWRYREAVKIEAPGAQQLELGLATLAHAQSGFADLRLCREGRQLPFVIERTSVLRPLKPESSRADDPRRPKFSRWQLKVPQANLPLTRLTCTSPTPLFQRAVALYEEASDERGTKYRRDLGSASWVQAPEQASKTLVLTIQTRPMTDTFYLETNNEDNPAIELSTFEFSWPATRVFFKTAVADGVFLYYGNAQAAAPQYDLRLVANQLLMADKHLATPGPEEELKKASWAERHAAGQGGWLLWCVLTVVVVALLVVIARLMPKQQPPPA